MCEKSVELVPNSIKDGHIKSLSENTIPEPRIEEYEQLNWIVFEIISPLILRNMACIFHTIAYFV